MQKSIIEAFPEMETLVSIVWLHMLQGDSESSAEESARIFSDHPVRQFYDPNQQAGKAVAESVGWRGQVAWDIYLFYPVGGIWAKGPPTPSVWMHQLSEPWSDREHYRSGDDLVKALLETMKRLTGPQSQEGTTPILE